jgi:hypothetical protein
MVILWQSDTEITVPSAKRKSARRDAWKAPPRPLRCDCVYSHHSPALSAFGARAFGAKCCASMAASACQSARSGDAQAALYAARADALVVWDVKSSGMVCILCLARFIALCHAW